MTGEQLRSLRCILGQYNADKRSCPEDVRFGCLPAATEPVTIRLLTRMALPGCVALLTKDHERNHARSSDARCYRTGPARTLV